MFSYRILAITILFYTVQQERTVSWRSAGLQGTTWGFETVEPATLLQQRQALLKWLSIDRYAFLAHRSLHCFSVSLSCSHGLFCFLCCAINGKPCNASPMHDKYSSTMVLQMYVICHTWFRIPGSPSFLACVEKIGELGNEARAIPSYSLLTLHTFIAGIPSTFSCTT